MNADLLASSMAWMDALWDDDAALLWSVRRDRHLVRETAWYALGSLQRGDAGLASLALDAVIGQQLHVPKAPFDGTFRRSPEEGDPPADAVMWLHYDPNWRQFIGTTFALICERFGDDLDASLVDRLRASIATAVSTEGPDRVPPTYSNIALMKAWLDGDAAYARSVADAFSSHGAFLEYNSPTYYGIDLFALALWRTSADLAPIGAPIEAALWRDIAGFYHAGLRNLCGPYDRSYGMDMTAHATPLGLWIWRLVGRELAPFPDPAVRFSHPHDFCFAPCIAALEAEIPDDALSDLRAFSGERTIERTISTDPRRVATAWLGDDVMIGAHAGPPSGIGWFQHHHATIHWRRPDAGIGWMRLRPGAAVDATAAAGRLRLEVETDDPIVFEVNPSPRSGRRGWASDGISVSVETDASGPQPGGTQELVYAPARGSTTFVLTLDRS